MENAITWFESPVLNMVRAVAFYSTILDTKLEVFQGEGASHAFFPGNGVTGSLTQGDGFVPGDRGPIIYLNAGDDLSPILARVEAAGGKVAMPRTSIGEHGFIAYVIDTEGNRIGLHSTH